MKKENKICIWGAWYTSHNVGDKAILKTIVGQLREFDPHIQFTVFSADVKFVEEHFYLDSVNPRKNPLRFIRELKCARLMIVGGGTPLYDDLIHMLYFITIVLFSKLFRTKLVLYAVSAQDIKGFYTKALIRLGLNRFDIITVRERLTKEFLESLHLKKDVVLTVDPAIMLRERKVNIELDGCRKKIGICLHFFSNVDRYRIHHYSKFNDMVINNYLDVMKIIVEDLSKKYELYFIPMNAYKPDNDVEFADLIMGRLRNKRHIHNIVQQYEPEEILYILRQLDIVIGARLHSIILSSVAGIPFMAISYGRKTKGYCQRIGMEDFCLDIIDLNKDRILQRIDIIFNNYQEIRRRMTARVDNMLNVAKKNSEMIHNLYKA